jgi:hypothetical protein
MSRELIKQKLIEHLMLYGFEYAWFTDENSNRVYFSDYDGTVSFRVPTRFYSINRDYELRDYELNDYELHIEQNNNLGTRISGIRIVVYQTTERSLDKESIECIENVDFIEEIPLAINKVLCSLASSNFNGEVHSDMVDVFNCIHMNYNSKNPNIDSRDIMDFIKQKIEKFLP